MIAPSFGNSAGFNQFDPFTYDNIPPGYTFKKKDDEDMSFIPDNTLANPIPYEFKIIQHPTWKKTIDGAYISDMSIYNSGPFRPMAEVEGTLTNLFHPEEHINPIIRSITIPIAYYDKDNKLKKGGRRPSRRLGYKPSRRLTLGASRRLGYKPSRRLALGASRRPSRRLSRRLGRRKHRSTKKR